MSAATPGPVATLRAALALLTRLPMASPVDPATTGAAAFPLVGIVVGLLPAGILIVVGAREPVLAALGAVATGVLLTGALHLDGLGDTADALAVGDPERAEPARTDPSSGPAGVTAIVLAVGVEVAALASLATDDRARAAGALVACAAVARTMPVVAAACIGDAPGSGFGAWFIRGVRPFDAIVATVLATLIVAGAALLVADVAVAIGAAIGAAVGAAGLAWLMLRRGALDGDGFGAGIVITGLAGLATTAVLR